MKETIKSAVKTAIQKIKGLTNRFLPTKKRKIIASIIFIVLIILIGRFISNIGDNQEEIEKTDRKVEIARVFDAISRDIDLPVVGTVESNSEAILRAQTQGEISAVYKKLGDPVSSGTIIAEIRNDNQRAEVLRAQGVLDGARANLSKIEGNSSENVALVLNSIRQSFITADDAIRTKVDQFFTEVSINNATMINALQNYAYRQIVEDERAELEKVLRDWRVLTDSLSADTSVVELDQKIDQSLINLEKVSNFLSNVSVSLNDFEAGDNISQSQIDKYRSDVSIARTNVANSLNNLLNTSNTIGSQLGLDQKGEDVLSAEASVTQARASLLNAQANLEKTIVRSPIKGQVNALNISRGDIVSSFEEVAHIVGDGSVEIVTYINEEDRERINIGASVSIGDSWSGEVIRIAPAINPSTNKIEVRISPDEGVDLRNGQSISLKINRDLEIDEGLKIITLPISAVKITTDRSEVFIFNQETSTVSTKEVETGRILGDRVVITDGLLLDDIIVLDARGLKDGQKVTY